MIVTVNVTIYFYHHTCTRIYRIYTRCRSEKSLNQRWIIRSLCKIYPDRNIRKKWKIVSNCYKIICWILFARAWNILQISKKLLQNSKPSYETFDVVIDITDSDSRFHRSTLHTFKQKWHMYAWACTIFGTSCATCETNAIAGILRVYFSKCFFFFLFVFSMGCIDNTAD